MMRVVLLLCLVFVIGFVAGANDSDATSVVSSMARLKTVEELVSYAQTRTAKIYGGKIGLAEGYASGVIISSDGLIVTTLSTMLDARVIRVVLDDGRRFQGQVLKRDRHRQLALLKIDVDGLSYADLSPSAHLQPGDVIVAAANAFKIADGPEPVTVVLGTFSGRTQLDARRRQSQFGYDGEVLLTDVVLATPGSAGGGFFDIEGNLVGIIGKAVISNTTNTWINYAIKSEEIVSFMSEEDTSDQAGDSVNNAKPWLGLRLFDIGGRNQPAYVERVTPNSPAQIAGIRADDLLVSVNGKLVNNCEEANEFLASLIPGEIVTVVIKGRDELKTVQLQVGEVAQ